MSTPALDLTQLTVTYRSGTAALNGIDLRVEDGECLAVIGESGCGKSTLVKACLGLLPFGARIGGGITVAGTPMVGATQHQWRELRGSRIGYVAQDPYASCDPLRTVHHHVRQAWRAKGLKPEHGEIPARLEDLGVAAERLDAHPHTWSGGMLQRATITAATALGPSLILADEPTSALDTELSTDVLTALRERSAALLLISHDLSLVAAHADRIAIIDGGRIVECGPTNRVIAAPQHRQTRKLLAAARVGPGGSAITRTRSTPPPRTPAPVVELDGVSRTYRRGRAVVPAVRNVSLRIEAGEILGLAGRSGSGKSTLLRLVAGMERPDGGSVRMSGSPVWAARSRTPRWPRPGYVMPVFQDAVASLDRRWPLWRSITEPLSFTADPPDRAGRRRLAREELDRIGLADLPVDALPGQLSVGQCQRVAIARALIAGPTLVVADEPTAALDVVAASVITEMLGRAAERGCAIVVVSHDLPRLAGFTHRILTIEPPGRTELP
ncbi:ABC transporter ATP-binding protein [Nakamurella silvestris]|nr:ABC transporter ATP-binding protein [Nakamurella silvestris]